VYTETAHNRTPPHDTSSEATATATYEDFATRIQVSWQKRTSSIFVVAEACNEANTQLTGKSKKKLLDELPFSKATFVKLSQIGGDQRLRGIAEQLPASFSIIYEITLLSDEQFEQAVASNKIRPKVQRNEIIKLRNLDEPSNESADENEGAQELPAAKFEAGKLYKFQMPTDEAECGRIGKVLAKLTKKLAVAITPA
jgi:hypothetical protein